jgi:hypothetical protein
VVGIMSDALEKIISQLSPSSQRLFACDCAEYNLLLVRETRCEPDERLWNAIRVAREFAMGRATEEGLNEAWHEAWDAANYRAPMYGYGLEAETAPMTTHGLSYIAARYYANRFIDSRDECKWQLSRAKAYLEAETIGRPALMQRLIAALNLRAQQRKQVHEMFMAELEEGLFA